MQYLNNSFSISITKLSNNKILFNANNIIINNNINPYEIISNLLNDYQDVKVDFINFNNYLCNNITFTLEINNKINHEIINPEENYLYYLNKYNKDIDNTMLLKYNNLGLTIIGLIIKQILLNDYNIKIFTHINSIKNIYDKIDDFENLYLDIEIYNKEKLPIIDLRAKQLMVKLINKSINDKYPLSGSLETIIYNLPKGLGSPYFNLFETKISSFLFLIQGLKGLEFANVYSVNNNLIKPYCNINFVNDMIKYDSNVYYGVLEGKTTKDIVRFNTHFLPPFTYSKNSTSINYKTLESVYIEKTKHEYFNLHKKIVHVDAFTAICIYSLLKD